MAGRQYFAQSNQNTFVGNAHTLSVTIPSGLTNSILVIIKSTNTALPWTTFTSLTVNGTATGVVDIGNSGSGLANRSIRAWYVLNPTPGTYNVVAQFNTSSGNGGLLSAVLYNDVDQTTPIADFKGASSGSTPTPITTATLATPSGAWVVGAARALNATSVTPAGGSTTIGTANADEAHFERLDATTLSCAWGGTSPTQASIIAVALRPAAGGGDVTAPTLTSPTATTTGSSTASGSVSTNEANGTLYRLASTSGSVSVATVKASGSTSTVSATGVQAVSFTGLAASTTYFAHYVHTDAAGNDSAVSTSASFTTSASGDTTVPVLTGSITVGTVTTTSIAISWPAGSDNVAVTSYEVSTNAGTSYTDVGNVLTTTLSGLASNTSYSIRVRAKDGAGNVSTPALAVTQSTAVGGANLVLPALASYSLTNYVSLSNITVYIHALTGTLVATKTSQVTNASGVMTINDAALVAGTAYRVIGVLADGGEFFNKVVAT